MGKMYVMLKCGGAGELTSCAVVIWIAVFMWVEHEVRAVEGALANAVAHSRNSSRLARVRGAWRRLEAWRGTHLCMIAIRAMMRAANLVLGVGISQIRASTSRMVVLSHRFRSLILTVKDFCWSSLRFAAWISQTQQTNLRLTWRATPTGMAPILRWYVSASSRRLSHTQGQSLLVWSGCGDVLIALGLFGFDFILVAMALGFAVWYEWRARWAPKPERLSFGASFARVWHWAFRWRPLASVCRW